MSFIKNVFMEFLAIIFITFALVSVIALWSCSILGWIAVILIGIFYGVWWALLAFFVWLLFVAIFQVIGARL